MKIKATFVTACGCRQNLDIDTDLDAVVPGYCYRLPLKQKIIKEFHSPITRDQAYREFKLTQFHRELTYNFGRFEEVV